MQQLHRVRWRNTHYRGFRSRWNDSGLSSPETSGNARIGRKNGRMVQNRENNQNIIGKSPIRNKLQVKQDSGDIDAITAATITSRAFLAAIQTAYTAYIESMKGGNHE